MKKSKKICQKRIHCFYTNQKITLIKAAKRLVKRMREDIVSNMGYN